MNLTLLSSDIARRCPALAEDPTNAATVIENLIREELFPQIPGARTYPLFKHLADEHNLILLESELQDIISLCLSLEPEASKGLDKVMDCTKPLADFWASIPRGLREPRQTWLEAHPEDLYALILHVSATVRDLERIFREHGMLTDATTLPDRTA